MIDGGHKLLMFQETFWVDLSFGSIDVFRLGGLMCGDGCTWLTVEYNTWDLKGLLIFTPCSSYSGSVQKALPRGNIILHTWEANNL